MKLSIKHVTTYKYDGVASHSINEIRLKPRSDQRQRCLSFDLNISPQCNVFQYSDYFGNDVHSFSVNNEHDFLEISTNSIVETADIDYSRLQNANLVEQFTIMRNPQYKSSLAEYLSCAEYTSITAIDNQFFLNALPFYEHSQLFSWLSAVTAYINFNFSYSPGLTSVHTTVAQTIQLQAGVCQDFAHLMLAICRSNGIPARYISGYQSIADLNTACANFAQASHAWIEAYIPDYGWVGFDPTNNCTVNWRYVTVATGRDYHDITPTKGIYTSNCGQQMFVDVEVNCI